jgi:Ca2+-binding EF-hand superfamily protein
MTHTRFTLGALPRTVPADAAERGEGRYVSCGGGLSSTLDDFAAFYQMHLTGGTYQGKRVLKAESIAQMHTPQPNTMSSRQAGAETPWEREYGLGLFLARKDDKGQPRTIHHGGALGTMAWADTDRGLVGVFISQVPLNKAMPVIMRVQAKARELVPTDSAAIAGRPAEAKPDDPRAARRRVARKLAERPQGRGADLVFRRLSGGKDKVSKEQFAEFLKQRAPRLGERPQLIDRLFDRLDVDHDGSLSADEFKKARNVAPDDPKPAAGKNKKKGGDDKAEVAIARKLAPRPGKSSKKRGPEATFRALSEGKDTVSKDRFATFIKEKVPKLDKRPQVAERLFDRFDADHDGSLSLDEFKKMSEKLNDLRPKAPAKKKATDV